ncbi:GH92 family glycosyl hydrolase [Asanoa siamensis]|uniref:Alpha-1 2-mannosidase n=1 Tax=Asanoa siamensis TaxID=926357 RepID=A0ABQ4CP41_9ACTN|nr:GH92 family glycosyl hydrolase [Asanoa siamensis]GIF73064.1 alpha-1 2-mannosidase [Asanoa siamensis]
MLARTLPVVLIAVLAAVVPGRGTAAAAPADPAALVNPMIGTAAYGNTFPGPSTPFGMIQWGPDSAPRYGGGYGFEAAAIGGFGLNRMSGPGCPVFGDAPFLPVTGTPPADRNSATVGLRHANEQARAGRYTVTLDNGVRTELAAGKRSALAQFAFPAGQQATLLLKAAGGASVTDATVSASGTTEVTGTVGGGKFCGEDNRYRVHFAVTFDRPFTAAATWAPPAGVTGHGGIALSFPAGAVVRARTGISYVSVANARLNRDTVTGWDLAVMQATAQAQWNALLSRIQVTGGTAAQQTTFYTALYHALLNPNLFSDANRQYRGFDGVVRTLPDGQGDQYANFSGWDVYRTQVQLASLVAPEVMSDVVSSMLNNFDQSGRLPKWSIANDESYVMVGDPALPAIAAAHAFGARRFDTGRALRAMVAQASRPGAARPGTVYLDNRGYLPSDGGYGCCGAYGHTSTSLEYNVADFALASYARALGDTAVHSRFAERAQAWQHLLHPDSGFVQPRTADGTWKPGFDPVDNDFVDWAEGNSWRYTLMVPFNARGLIRAKGGNAAMTAYLDAHFTRLNDVDGPHAWMGNEPSFGTPWLYNWAGAPHKTQALVHRIRTELFRDAPDGLPGNDDLGSLSAWYVFAALGIYPAVPGTADLTVAAPIFTRADIRLPSGRTLTLDAPNAAGRPYIQSMTVDQANWNRTSLPPSLLTDGGTIRFSLAASPSLEWASSPDAAPPSYGTNAVAAADNHGISADRTEGQSDYDGWGSGYSRSALAGAGVVPGNRFAAGGVSYVWPNTRPGQPDNVVAAGQRLTVASPAGATRLGLLGSAEGQPAGAAGTLTVHYADGSTTPAEVGFSDWTLAGGTATARSDNVVAARMPYRNDFWGQPHDGPTYLFSTAVPVDPARAVVAVTLPRPAVGRLHVFAVGFGGHRDNAGISDDGYVGGGDFDGTGTSYSRQALATAGLHPGAPVVHGGVTYRWPATVPGQGDNLVAAGQTIPVAPGSGATKLGLLGAADRGGTTGVATLDYTDGTRQSVPLGFTDWTRAHGQQPIGYGNTVAAQLPYRNFTLWGGGRDPLATYVFAATIPTTPGKTLRSVTLPAASSGGRMHIFAVGTG